MFSKEKGAFISAFFMHTQVPSKWFFLGAEILY